MNKNTSYWFFLHKHVYVKWTESATLLYDTETGARYISHCEKQIELIKQLRQDENLGSILVSKEMLTIEDISKFVEEVVKLGIGGIVEAKDGSMKPIVLLPILCLNHDIDRNISKEIPESFDTVDISRYLFDVNVVLSESCNLECKNCQSYHKQFLCCHKASNCQPMSKELLNRLINQLSSHPAVTINVIGGNVYESENLNLLTNSRSLRNLNIYTYYKNYKYIESENIQYTHILIDAPLDLSHIETVKKYSEHQNFVYHIIAEDENDFDEISVQLAKIGVLDYVVHPFYNKRNQEFFENNVFLEEKDLFEKVYSMREIFRNEKINSNYFGTLFLLPNGDMKTSLSSETLGNLYQDDLVDIIAQELKQNTTWRMTRTGNPCCSCLYQYICPPPSPYETAIGKSDLCFMSSSGTKE